MHVLYIVFGLDSTLGKVANEGNSLDTKRGEKKLAASSRSASGSKQTQVDMPDLGFGVMQDAADRKRLGRSTFKNLNLGLAAIAAGNASALW